MDRTQQSAHKHPLSSGMDHALDGASEGPVKQLRRPGDNGPALQSLANNSPQVKQLKATEAAANTAVIQRKASNETGLPQALQAGMESLSGFSLDHVRVAYNSSKPAEVHALAYAEGSKIYIAPGQEEHLPEELGHVVQQMQGKVKATTEVAGKAVNDDAGMEKEAQEMGAKAEKMAGHSKETDEPQKVASPAADALVQLRVAPASEKENSSKLYKKADGVANKIDKVVESARLMAINWVGLDVGNDKYLQQWVKAADTYAKNPEQPPKLLHARFGYAIESIASKQLKNTTIDGLSVHLQESHGHTRPDIVLKENSEPVAWLDITASSSEGHIFEKQSTGWSTKPYVAEIVYDSLELSEVLKACNDPMINDLAGYFSEKGKTEQKEVENERYVLQSKLLDFAIEKGFWLGGRQVKKQGLTRDFLKSEDVRMPLGDNVLQGTKGAVVHTKLNKSIFGFKKSKPSQDIQAVTEYLDKKAAPAIQLEYVEINKTRLKQFEFFLKLKGQEKRFAKLLKKMEASLILTEELSNALTGPMEEDDPSPEFMQEFTSAVSKQSELVELAIAIEHSLPLIEKAVNMKTFLEIIGALGSNEKASMAAIVVENMLQSVNEDSTAIDWRGFYIKLKDFVSKKLNEESIQSLSKKMVEKYFEPKAEYDDLLEEPDEEEELDLDEKNSEEELSMELEELINHQNEKGFTF